MNKTSFYKNENLNQKKNQNFWKATKFHTNKFCFPAINF